MSGNSYPVKVFKSTDAGAPTLPYSGLVGGELIAILDACFSTGYNSKTITTLTQTGGVATAYYAAGHNHVSDDVILVAGANEAGFNGDAMVTVVDSTHLTFPVPVGTPSTATGTITSKFSPASNWVKVFSGTNKAAYQSNDTLGSRFFFKIMDNVSATLLGSAYSAANMLGFETMQDIDTGTGQFPNPAQVAAFVTPASPAGLWIWKSLGASTETTARKWWVVADSRAFYLIIGAAGTTNYLGTCTAYFFGDLLPRRAGDIYSVCIQGDVSATTGQWPNTYNNLFLQNNSTYVVGRYIARPYTGMGVPVRAFNMVGNPGDTYMGGSNGFTYPDVVANQVFLGDAPAKLFEETSNYRTYRASMPGFFVPWNSMEGGPQPTPNTGDIIKNVAPLTGRRLMWSKCSSASTRSYFCIDLTGPWR